MPKLGDVDRRLLRSTNVYGLFYSPAIHSFAQPLYHALDVQHAGEKEETEVIRRTER